jgi:3-oxoacyl-[acyl-carrier-protein] synthase-1
MKAGVGIGTRGFEEYGVSEQINVIRDNFKHEINSVLKLASGFGGSNAAVLIRKNV